MKRYSRNIQVVAENNGNQNGFNVYLVFSGQREYLFTHRHNGAMFGMLKDGIRLADLQRGIRSMNIRALCSRRMCISATRQLLNSLRWLLVVIDEYIEDRTLCA